MTPQKRVIHQEDTKLQVASKANLRGKFYSWCYLYQKNF